MKLKLFLALTLLTGLTVPAGAAPSERFCEVMKEWRLGTHDAPGLCRKYRGSFCSWMTHMGQAICAANGKSFCTDMKTVGQGICRAGDGHFCDSIKTVAGGLCSTLGGHFCDSVGDDEEAKWIRQLVTSCKL